MKNKKAVFFIIAIFALFVLLSGCTQQQGQDMKNAAAQNDDAGKQKAQADEQKATNLSPKELAIAECEMLCKDALKLGWDLSKGPCLSAATLSWEVNDWVCDIAHSPREAVDNIKENQCPTFGISANHFVEFDPDCKFIKAI